MILIIDNYDSFVYNIARYVGRIGRERVVLRNDAVSIAEIAGLNPTAIILSPGPKTPKQSGLCMSIIKNFYRHIPILGICLGHQCIGEAFGGRTIKAPKPVHGKTSPITHDGTELFMGMPTPMDGARYHSLITELPANSPLQVIAQTADTNINMGMRHPDFPLFGLQFHPESVLTDYGFDIIRNFIVVADMWKEQRAAA